MSYVHFGIMNLVAALVEDLVCLEIRIVGRREAFIRLLVHELLVKENHVPVFVPITNG
jgi:hypothetical protein